MLLEKEYDEMTWEYGMTNKQNLMFEVETKSNGFTYSFEIFFDFPNEFRIEVYHCGDYWQRKAYSYCHEYKRFDYLLDKLKKLIDANSNGTSIHTIIYNCRYTSLIKHLSFLSQSDEL